MHRFPRCQNNLSFFPASCNLQLKSDKEGRCKMMKKTYWVAGLLLALQILIGTPEASASSRATKKIGLSVGILTEPFPSVIGYNLSYNLAKFLRLGVGYGNISLTSTAYTVDVTTIAFDVKGFLLDWNFAPFLNLGYTNVSGTISGTGSASGLSVTSTGGALYYGAGIDWQTYLGFNLGFEYKMFTKNSQTVGAPGLYLGWYF